uniref:Anthranilate synthase component I-2 n=1 Tax=Rhizophora mucronata TaxID=61149 RepID=A0A2P2KK18_RHIMU
MYNLYRFISSFSFHLLIFLVFFSTSESICDTLGSIGPIFIC